MESRADYDPFDHRELVGWPCLAMSRGEILFRDGRVLSKPGRGRLLRRARYQPL
jgi:dihydropyrimidinase